MFLTKKIKKIVRDRIILYNCIKFINKINNLKIKIYEYKIFKLDLLIKLIT